MGKRHKALQNELSRMDILHRRTCASVLHPFSHPSGLTVSFCYRRRRRYDEARKIYRDISMKNLDWPEAVWEAWVSFEQLYGTLEQIEDALDRVQRAQTQVNARRAKVRRIHHPPAPS